MKHRVLFPAVLATRRSALRRGGTASRAGEGGFALLGVLIVLAALTGFVMMTQLSSRTEQRIGGNQYANVQAYYAAETGVEKFLAESRRKMINGFLTQEKVDSVSTVPPKIPGYKFTEYKATLDTTDITRSITQGPYAGLSSLDNDLRVVSSVESPGGARATVEMSARAQAIPIFQFAVFYEKDLEILNGPPMNVRGRVHTNSDLYASGNTELYLWDMATAAGDYHRDFKSSYGWFSNSWRKTFMRLNDDSFKQVIKDTHDFGGDHDPTTFPSKAQDKAFNDYSKAELDHKLQTRASGIVRLNLPIPDGMDPYQIIQPCTGTETPGLKATRFGCLADRIIRVRGTQLQVVDRNGNPKPFGDSDAVRFYTNKFYDDREQTSSTGNATNATWRTSNRDVIEIDIEEIDDDEYDNGIIYITADSMIGTAQQAPRDQRQYVVRVRDGEELEEPLTIATNLPLYVMGDYNEKNDEKWQPASFASDAITLLSDNWDDSKSGEGFTENLPQNLEVSAAILAGHTETPFFGSPDAGGQFENFPRFLENFSGKTVTINGSFVSLWTARIANSMWINNGSFYSPPMRNWNFDENFLDPELLPPGTPLVGQILRVSFTRRY
jgi:hypothetical protein